MLVYGALRYHVEESSLLEDVGELAERAAVDDAAPVVLRLHT